MPLRSVLRWSELFVTLLACGQHVTVRPAVSTSLGYPVFKAMGEIRRYPLHVGSCNDPKLEEENNEEKKFRCCSRRFALGS